MVTLSDVKSYLKSFGLFDGYYIGRLDTKKKNSLGVYNLQDTGRHETIGGLKVYEKKGISLLVHGDTNKASTEALAWSLYNKLEDVISSLEFPVIGEHKVYFMELLQNQPIDVDQDDKDVYEYVIELNIYFEK